MNKRIITDKVLDKRFLLKYLEKFTSKSYMIW